MSHLEEENKKLRKIIKILNEGYKSFHMTGAMAIDFSKEATTETYREIQTLQILLYNVLHDIDGFED